MIRMDFLEGVGWCDNHTQGWDLGEGLGLIQEALEVLMEGRTTFIIAQRLLTLKNADVILVLDHGRIVERGSHEALLEKQGLYRQIYDLQLKDQEEFVTLQNQIGLA